MAQKNKKGHAGLIIFIIVLILAIGGGAGFYFYQRQQPQKAAEKFLDSMKNMDFSTMESMLQSSDLSALDNADIRNAAYTDFFTAINQKMTCVYIEPDENMIEHMKQWMGMKMFVD